MINKRKAGRNRIPMSFLYTIMAGHEVTHRFQVMRGDIVPASMNESGFPVSTYFTDQHEEEAWVTVLDIARKIN